MRKIIPLIALFLVASITFAQAQDTGFDSSITTDCIASLELSDDAAQCIGQSATACLTNEADGVSSTLKQLCVFSELEEWQKRLEVVYPALLDHLQDQDDQVLVWGWGQTSKAEALQNFDDAWYPNAEAECRFEQSLWEGLEGRDDYLWCQMKQTAEYVLLLETAIRDTCRHDHCQEEKYPKWPN